MFDAGPALAADSAPSPGAWTACPGRPQAVCGRVRDVRDASRLDSRGRPAAGPRQARRPPPVRPVKAGGASDAVSGASPRRHVSPAARFPAPGAWAGGLTPLPQALARALPVAPVCRRHPRLGGVCPSRPPPAFRRAPASRFPTCPARLGRSAPPRRPRPAY